jgi:hypothetical protein
MAVAIFVSGRDGCYSYVKIFSQEVKCFCFITAKHEKTRNPKPRSCKAKSWGLSWTKHDQLVMAIIFTLNFDWGAW